MGRGEERCAYYKNLCMARNQVYLHERIQEIADLVKSLGILLSMPDPGTTITGGKPQFSGGPQPPAAATTLDPRYTSIIVTAAPSPSASTTRVQGHIGSTSTPPAAAATPTTAPAAATPTTAPAAASAATDATTTTTTTTTSAATDATTTTTTTSAATDAT